VKGQRREAVGGNISRIELGEADTFPKMLRRLCQKHGDRKPALRKKRYGIWRSHTWRD